MSGQSPCDAADVTEISYQQVLSRGRRLDVVSAGPSDAVAFVFHGGTPTAAVPYQPAVDAVLTRGLRYVSYSRPGYAGSDPQPGRVVADAAADVAAILEQLGAAEFVTAGWSGGGPHALACAALLPQRCKAAATIAGVAPYPAEGMDWLAGMGKENHDEFGAALQGEQVLTPWLETAAAQLTQVTGAEVAAAFGDLISDVDRASLTGEFAAWVAALFRAAVSTGVAGWRDDDLAFVTPWGFDLAAITCPVFVWQGEQDRMVPFDHGRWLARQVAGSTARLLPGEGHLSIAVGAFERIVDDLVHAARAI
jgi:pimeloyl-ACP methyl ester carboxylesterase